MLEDLHKLAEKLIPQKVETEKFGTYYVQGLTQAQWLHVRTFPEAEQAIQIIIHSLCNENGEALLNTEEDKTKVANLLDRNLALFNALMKPALNANSLSTEEMEEIAKN